MDWLSEVGVAHRRPSTPVSDAEWLSVSREGLSPNAQHPAGQVDGAHELEQVTQGAGGVEVIVHGFQKTLAGGSDLFAQRSLPPPAQVFRWRRMPDAGRLAGVLSAFSAWATKHRLQKVSGLR